MPIHRKEPHPVPVTNEVHPDRTFQDDTVLRTRLRAFTVSAASELLFEFQNQEGVPYELEDDGSVFKAHVREMVVGGKPYTLPVTVKDYSKGQLLISVPANFRPGGYRGTVTMYRDDTPILTNDFRLYVSTDSPKGPPSLQEIRLYLRDTSRHESLLLEDRAFEDSEIMAAMERALRYWNETPPDLGRPASTHNFPYRHHLIEGTLGQLFMIAAEDYRKNSLQYQAGGLSVADKDKEMNYLKAAQYHWDTYRQFVDSKKSELNAALAWGTIPSPYSYIW